MLKKDRRTPWQNCAACMFGLAQAPRVNRSVLLLWEDATESLVDFGGALDGESLPLWFGLYVGRANRRVGSPVAESVWRGVVERRWVLGWSCSCEWVVGLQLINLCACWEWCGFWASDGTPVYKRFDGIRPDSTDGVAISERRGSGGRADSGVSVRCVKRFVRRFYLV